MTQHQLLAPVAHDMNALNDTIRQSLRSDVPLVNQISEYLIDAGGKRLRPVLVLLGHHLFEKNWQNESIAKRI